MHVEVNEVEYCKMEVLYTADPDAVKEKESAAVAELRKVQIPGFRAGKAPDYAIKARCKKQIANYVAKEMQGQAYDDIVFETKCKPIGYPKVLDLQLKNNDFSCKMLILKKPTFELGEYKGFEIPKPATKFNVEAEVEKAIQDLRVRFGEVRPYTETDSVELGDQVTMDISDDDKIKEEGVLYTIGENRYGTDFDSNVLGMVAGESRNVNGSSSVIKVTIHMGMKNVPCPMNDELAQKVGLQTFDEVRQKIAIIASQRNQTLEQDAIKQQIINRLLENTPFEVPAWLLDMEGQSIAMQNGLDWKKLDDETKKLVLDKAEKQVRFSLILDSVRDAEPEAILSEAEALDGLKKRAEISGYDPNKYLVEAQKNGSLFGLVAQMRDDFVMQYLISQSKIIGDN